MTKLSKSDQEIDREEHEKARERTANPARSTHFAKGTFINMYPKGRGLVVERWANALTIEWEETDVVETLYPYALS